VFFLFYESGTTYYTHFFLIANTLRKNDARSGATPVCIINVGCSMPARRSTERPSLVQLGSALQHSIDEGRDRSAGWVEQARVVIDAVVVCTVPFRVRWSHQFGVISDALPPVEALTTITTGRQAVRREVSPTLLYVTSFFISNEHIHGVRQWVK